MNFHKFLQIITNYHKLKKYMKKNQKFNIKKFIKNYILKKNQKFNINAWINGYIITYFLI